MVKQCLASMLLVFAALLPAVESPAATPSSSPGLAAPQKAIISPSKASLFVSETLPVQVIDGIPHVFILLPGNAENFQVTLEGCQIAQLTQRRVEGLPEGRQAAERARLEKEKALLQGKEGYLSAKISKASEEPGGEAEFVGMYAGLAEAKAKLQEIDEALKAYPKIPSGRILVSIALAGAEGKDAVPAEYNYVIPGCSWSPSYTINCMPQKDGSGVIDVRLEAAVTQDSCFDWKGTELTLVSANEGAVRPPSLRSWNIGSSRSSRTDDARLMDVASAKMAMPEAAMGMAAPKPAVVADTTGTYASWRPAMKGLMQGKSRILLAHASWTEPLTWVARPLNSDARVFLCAEHELEDNIVWPEGSASLSVDGAPIGKDSFRPRKGKVFLAFGNDPRVHLVARADPRKTGTTGFISKNKVWEWAWEYIVSNDRDTAAKVRVERPLPRSVNEDYTVEFTTEPPADARNAALTWELTVEPHQQQVLKHGVKVSAPDKAAVTPVAP